VLLPFGMKTSPTTHDEVASGSSDPQNLHGVPARPTSTFRHRSLV
jgi:hypothetical protein